MTIKSSVGPYLFLSVNQYRILSSPKAALIAQNQKKRQNKADLGI